jgi:hypothetical protein
MERTQLFFLNACGASQQLISRHKIAIRRGTFRPIEHLTSVLMFGHRVSGFPMQSVLRNCDCSPASLLQLVTRSLSRELRLVLARIESGLVEAASLVRMRRGCLGFGSRSAQVCAQVRRLRVRRPGRVFQGEVDGGMPGGAALVAVMQGVP